MSLDAQRSKVAAYADLYDLDLVEVIEDAGASAKTLRRDGLQRALALLEAGEADALLVVKLDRLTRSVVDLGHLVQRFFAPGRFTLLSVSEQFDTSTAAGRMVLNVLMSVFQWEREAIGERTASALAHLKSEGVQLGGEALGWTRDDATDEDGRKVVRKVKAEAATVERILALRAEGLTLQAIADTLTAEGLRTKRGGNWYPTTIRNVLKRAEA